MKHKVYLQQLLDMRMNRREFEKVSQPVFLGYYYKDSDHQDETIEVKAALNMFDELGTLKTRNGPLLFRMQAYTLLPVVYRRKLFLKSDNKLSILPVKFWV
ncbi:MAG: hypothetical protein ACLUOS_09655 [Odoribacter splanchnicus]